MSVAQLHLNLEGCGLRLIASLVPWDTALFGCTVAQIEALDVSDPVVALEEYKVFKNWLDDNEVHIVSCRLSHAKLRESMFLEAQDFRFIEMVLHPIFDRLSDTVIPSDNLIISSPTDADLSALREIAEQAFGHERFHIDPRVDSLLANKRYGLWVQNSLNNPGQRLLKIMDGEHIVALFIIGLTDDKTVNWLLTAIAPGWQGQGYGERVWRVMMRHHQENGFESVITTISARNVAVLNLYAKLQFRFLPPEMTFHWIRQQKQVF